jgi:hypothetical protein
LFDALFESQLPPLPLSTSDLLTATNAQWEEQQTVLKERTVIRERLVEGWELDGFGKFIWFEGGGKKKVGLFETTGGGHVQVLGYEGVIDLVGDFFHLD